MPADTYPMEQYIQVSILPEYYEKTTIILTEKYGDKIKTESCYIVDSVAVLPLYSQLIQ